MLRHVLLSVLGMLGMVASTPVFGAAVLAAPAQPVRVLVIPIRDEIAEPEFYILRRGLKEGADVIVLDLKTPGGALDTTMEMMEALEKFPGQTIAYVDNEAMSAGAFISGTTGEIWFAPDGIIGAAAPVTSTGQDVDSTMKEKLVSYLKARMRAVSEGKGYRGQVISAMIDADQELKIGDEVIKEKGQLLSLTATEAMKAYGKPPRPLLGAGIAKDLDDLLTQKFGAGGYTVRRLEITWSERLAVILNKLSPVLLGLGMLSLFIAFKTSGFGGFGVAGVALLAVVFLSSSVAGLSGHEPAIVFAVGTLMLVLELIFFHSAGFFGLVGLVMMVGSIVWSMADLWPNEPISVAWSTDAFAAPLANLGIGAAIAVALGVALLRFLPQGWVWDRLIVGSADAGVAQAAGAAPEQAGRLGALVGRRATVVTALRPAGQVEIDGQRYEAKVDVGTVDPGAIVVVRRRTDFGLMVDKIES